MLKRKIGALIMSLVIMVSTAAALSRTDCGTENLKGVIYSRAFSNNRIVMDCIGDPNNISTYGRNTNSSARVISVGIKYVNRSINYSSPSYNQAVVSGNSSIVISRSRLYNSNTVSYIHELTGFNTTSEANANSSNMVASFIFTNKQQ